MDIGKIKAQIEAYVRTREMVGGALITDFYELFGRPNVRFLSGFYGPLERLMRELKRRTRVVGISPNDAVLDRLVGGAMGGYRRTVAMRMHALS